ncbi:DNA-binding transcriptional ArsR family regulator [Roseateles asaccharophilus]|uniref:DNA-binding transcriptional ArsR family regulator n=2 Tax=Roseateles asaccharophilus TaxID=582607 RepID=A0ABU2A518_9BURK|nr:DNA-binding transcriptional ArsR family regulator [Roseateles asaccharophilus]
MTFDIGAEHVTLRAHMDAEQLDATFFALASDLRRRMLDLLKAEPGCNVNRVAEFFAAEVGRFAVMKHLAALERGGLVIAERQGRDKRLWFNVTPIQLLHERWTTEYSVYWASRLTRLKYDAEGAEVTPLQPKRKDRRHG